MRASLWARLAGARDEQAEPVAWPQDDRLA